MDFSGIPGLNASVRRVDGSNLAGPDAFFTICAKNFLAHARVLYNSLRVHYRTARFFVVLCDRVDGLFDPAQEPFEFVYLDQLNLPNLEEMADRYSITEFNTAVKPFAFVHLMEAHGFSSIVYLDPDLLVVDRMTEVDELLGNGAEAVLTPHLLEPAEKAEMHDGMILLFGVYNLGFLALRNTPSVRSFLSWWGRRLERECVVRLEKGLFVDQRWADLLPAFVAGTQILHHPGYNVAYWNLPQRKIEHIGDHWFANGQPLRFVHFSGNSIDQPEVFSRHSLQVTQDSIGDLRQLLKHYRERVLVEGHDFYRSLPYAYSWNGQAAENLHTPKSLDRSAARAQPPMEAERQEPGPAEASGDPRWLRRLRTLRRALPMGRKVSGGWSALARNAWAAYRVRGWGYVKARAVELSHLAFESAPTAAPAAKRVSGGKQLLYLDWGIPKPDRDAGSLLTVLLIRIMHSLGYEVTFVPCDLRYVERYCEALSEAGARVICYPEIHSVGDWLRANASAFDLCFLSRGPVVWPHLQTLKRFAPDLRLIFHTVDLHHVRELREAELNSDWKARAAALATRKQEFDLIRHCELTILLSDEELYLVREECPDAPLAVLPLVFADIPGAVRSFDQRKDILFIGSYGHPPNADAVVYFAREVFPLIQKRLPDIRFKVVGAAPPKLVADLAKDNAAIDVVGFVSKLEPLFEGIRLSVAPLRFGAGIKGKIGSSLCYGVPCVATPMAIEGMGLEAGRNVLVGATPAELAEGVCQAYQDESLWRRISAEGHRFALEQYSVDRIRERVRSLLAAASGGWLPIESGVELDGWEAYQRHRVRMEGEYRKRLEREQALIPAHGSPPFRTGGYCAVCQRATEFLTSFMHSARQDPDGRPLPNWREHMTCQHCGLVNRVRAAFQALHTLAAPGKGSRIYVTEQVTSTYRWLHDRYPRLTGSEYFGADRVPGAMVDGNRHEDLMRLSFEDSSFDRVLSFDVLEHLPDPQKAFREVFRVLDDGGVFLFSAPFAFDRRQDVVRATLLPDCTIEHHLPAEYHGNPVDPEAGALCFRYYGWDVLDRLREIGFFRVRALAYWSERQGYLGEEQFLFLAEKRAGHRQKASVGDRSGAVV